MMIKIKWPVLSFKEISATDPELAEAQTQSGGAALKGDIYKIEMCRLGNSSRNRGDFKKVSVDIEQRITFFVGSGSLKVVLLRDEDGPWRPQPTR